MTEAAAGGGRAEMERRIVQRSLQDDAFRQQLLADPKGTVEQELGTPLPEGVEVRAVEETADTVFLVLPSRSAGAGAGGGLSDQDLESVAGGGWGDDDTSQCRYLHLWVPPNLTRRAADRGRWSGG